MQVVVNLVFPLVVALLPGAAPCEGKERGVLPAACAVSLGMERLEQAADEPATAVTVLALGGLPARVLVAKQHEPLRFSLLVLTHEGWLLESRPLLFPSAEEVPEAGGKAWGRLDDVRQLRKKHGLALAEPCDLPAHGLAMLSRRMEKDAWRLVLVTSAGERELLVVPRKGTSQVGAWSDKGGTLLVLAGWVDPDGPGEGPQAGVFELVPLASGLKELPAETVASVLVADGERMLDRREFGLAAAAAGTALERSASESALSLAVRAFALAGDWKEAGRHLGRLEALGTEAGRQRFEEVWRVPVVREARLRTMDINGSRDLVFKAAKGFEGTSVWVKIKDGSGRNLAIFKPTNGNTYHRGEVFTYQMSKILGLEEMYPVTFLLTLDRRGCEKFVGALEEVQYKSFKEANRKKLVQICVKGGDKGGLEGAVKEWVPDFQFFQAIGTVERVKKHSLFRHLCRDGAFPEPGRKLRARTVTKLYKPDECKSATYVGELDVGDLARDLSDLMVMDVLNANEDRFPGANVDFKSLGKALEVRKCEFDFGPSRLYSLDNGATFKGTYSNGFVDFTKRLKPSRFHRRTFRRLDAVSEFVKGRREVPRCLAVWGIDSVESLSTYLALDKGDDHPRRKAPFNLFVSNMEAVLKRMRAFDGDRDAWFR